MNDRNEQNTPDPHSDDTTRTEARHKILVAEDDPEMRALISRALQRAGYSIIACANGIALLDRLRTFVAELRGTNADDEPPDHADLIISDIRMPGVTGLEILEGLQHGSDVPPMILITAFGDDETHRFAKKLGAAAVLDKPFDMDELLIRVRDLVH